MEKGATNAQYARDTLAVFHYTMQWAQHARSWQKMAEHVKDTQGWCQDCRTHTKVGQMFQSPNTKQWYFLCPQCIGDWGK
jgi:Zn finger protein HypA/HybF involved in hydrogenase expression